MRVHGYVCVSVYVCVCLRKKEETEKDGERGRERERDLTDKQQIRKRTERKKRTGYDKENRRRGGEGKR